jgi:hypothetical protein
MTTPYTVYIIAAQPSVEKAIGDRWYHSRMEAEGALMGSKDWTNLDVRVWEAEITIHDTPNDTGADV